MVANKIRSPEHAAPATTDRFRTILTDLKGDVLHLVLRDHVGNEIERLGLNRGDCLDALSGDTYSYARYEVIDIL